MAILNISYFSLFSLLLVSHQALAQNQTIMTRRYAGCGSVGGAGANWAYTRDLGKLGFDNVPVSAHGHGIWIVYENTDYNQFTPGDSEVILLLGSTNSECHNLQTLQNRVSSWKYVGVPNNYRADTITIYEGTNYQGQEVYLEGDHPKLAFSGNTFGSAIVTGSYDIGWTVYEYTGYRGRSFCLRADGGENYYPHFMPNIDNAPFSTVGSVKKYCQPENFRSSVEENPEFIAQPNAHIRHL